MIQVEDLDTFEKLETNDGSVSLIHPFFGEAYSSIHGAAMQARELYLISSGVSRCPAPKIIEMGFGLGMNFRTTLENCLSRGVYFEYFAIEGFPVDPGILAGVPMDLSERAQEVWLQIIYLWGKSFLLEEEWGRLEVIVRDIAEVKLPSEWANAVYFDPFSPEVNPEPWKATFLARIFASCLPGAVLVSYSVAGVVRRTLEGVGFTVEKIGAVGKRSWCRAEKPVV